MDYFGTIKGGIDWLKDKDQDKLIGIELIKNKRSIAQNSLYWKYLEIIENETGNNAIDLHELFKRKFLPPIFSKVKIKGKIIEYKRPASTTQLNKINFGDYLDKICALTGIPIPQYEPILSQ